MIYQLFVKSYQNSKIKMGGGNVEYKIVALPLHLHADIQTVLFIMMDVFFRALKKTLKK